MIHESQSDFVKNNLVSFFMYEGAGKALFEEQDNGMIVCIPNLTKYYTNSILPAIKKGLLFSAEQNGKMVGFCYADANLNDFYKLKSPVISGAFTFVLPDFRRKGIATELRKRLFEEIKSQGYKLVFCQIYEDNKESLSSMEPFFKTTKHKKFNGYRAEIC